MFVGNIDSETAQRCEYLIRKHAPALMRLGDFDGIVRRGRGESKWTRRGPEVRKKILELRAQGWQYYDIEAETGVPRSTIQYIVLKDKKDRNKEKEKQ